jgi:hypothetical protein
MTASIPKQQSLLHRLRFLNITSTILTYLKLDLQGVVGFYDARDLTACRGTCSWTPRAGFIGPLIGTADIKGDGWVMAPRFSSAENTGIVGDQPYTAIVAFKDVDSYPDTSFRTLTYLGGSSVQGYRLQLLTNTLLSHSGSLSDTSVSFNGMRQQSGHLWASTYLGGQRTTQYWNGATYSQNVSGPAWNTDNTPLQVGATSGQPWQLKGGIKFVLIANRALSASEVAAVAQWSWESHAVGLDLMNFSPGRWTTVTSGHSYWQPPSHMQPLSTRTISLCIDIKTVTRQQPFWRSIVQFHSINTQPYDNSIVQRRPAIWIYNERSLYVSMNRHMDTSEYYRICDIVVSGPIFATFVFTRYSLSIFINSKKTCSWTFEYAIADTDATLLARRLQENLDYDSAFSLRSLRLLDFAMPDLEAQSPVIVSVTPQILLPSHTSLTVIGSPFAAGLACSALFLDSSLLTDCNAVSAVEIVIRINAGSFSRASMLSAIVHNGLIFRVPMICALPFFVVSSSGSCTHVSSSIVSFGISPSDRIAGKANVAATLMFTVTVDVPPRSLVTLRFPPHFFMPSVYPSVDVAANNVPGLTITYNATGNDAIVLTTSGANISAFAMVAVTINGLKMGSATPNSVNVTLTAPFGAPSLPVASGSIFEAAGSGGAVSLSQYTAFASNVVMTVSFVAAPAVNSAAIKAVSVTGLRFSHSSQTSAFYTSCSNLNVPNVTVSTTFVLSSGALLLNLSPEAAPAIPIAPIICTVPGLRNAEVAADAPTLSGGDGFIQIGAWRFGIADENHFSFSSNNGNTALILRSDGAYIPGNGQRKDYGHSHKPITWIYSSSKPIALNNLPNVTFGPSWVQFGSVCRIGTHAVCRRCLSVSFRTRNERSGSSGLHTSGVRCSVIA